MILKKQNEEFCYEGKRFYVGQRIIGTNRSEYEGLFGTILEIRDGLDKETENETPDIYCSFDKPLMPHEIEHLEKVFTGLYGESKKIEDICLDKVIMAPEMIAPLDEELPQVPVYVVTEDWAYEDQTGFTYSVHSDLKSAVNQMRKLVANEYNDGLICLLRSHEDFVEESTENSYEIYTDGFYCELHYAIEINGDRMQIDPAFIETVKSLK